MSVKIHSIRLRNCQSWKDTSISLAGGLNVITAPNQTGKSVIFKMLKITCSPTYYTRQERQLLIRYGAEYAEVTYLFTDMSAALVRVFPQRIIYFYTDNCNTTPFTQQEGIPHRAILEKLSAIVEQESGFIANILDLDQNLLLVNTNNKSNDNLLKILTEHEDLTRLVELFTTKYPIYRNKLNDVEKTKYRLEYALEDLEYVNIDKLERDIKLGDAYLRLSKSLLQSYELINDISINSTDTINYEELISLAELGIKLEDIQDIDVTNFEKEVDVSVIDLCNTAIKLESIYAELIDIPMIACDINSDMINLFSKMVDIYDELDSLPVIKDTSRIDKALRITSSVECLLDLHNELINLGKIEKRYAYGLKLEEDYIKRLDIEGKSFECAIHGRIKIVNNECIPV